LYHFEYNFYICNSYILTTCVFPNTAIELVCNRNEDFFFTKVNYSADLLIRTFIS